MSQQLAHSPQQLLVLLLLLLSRKAASSSSSSSSYSPIIHDGGRRRVHLPEVSVMVYALLVCCIVCFILPDRCHSHALTLGQHSRNPSNSPLGDITALTSPYWQQRFSHPYPWPPWRSQWNQLEVQNCCPAPKDILSEEEVLAHERAIQRAAESQRYLRRTQRILRLQHLQWLSHREFLASFGKAPTRRKLRRRHAVTATEGVAMTTNTMPSTVVDTTTSTVPPLTTTVSHPTSPIEASGEGALATVHRLAIRSKTVSISSGVMSARLRYLIQLHRTFEGKHRLLVEVRLHPQYPPIYTGPRSLRLGGPTARNFRQGDAMQGSTTSTITYRSDMIYLSTPHLSALMSPSSAYASATMHALLFGPPTATLTPTVQNQPASPHPPPPLLTMWVVRTCMLIFCDSRKIEVQHLLKRMTVEDVCAYWPANAPGSECSLKKRRFYQKGRICLCHMPPGIYHQRLKINFSDVFEGAQISQFLINILFSGQHLNLYVTSQLVSATNSTVACSQSKIPVSFSSP
ncbi:hypothetical protein TcWFU_005442 [Taenia crassiceps]|uniref:DUF5739 domain-containing protein n=1 Tax=Taenia crassiceps TaxID=6207 RepID=A0ABR4QRT1_9CEST